jgi:arylamine N-acetyltransferase
MSAATSNTSKAKHEVSKQQRDSTSSKLEGHQSHKTLNIHSPGAGDSNVAKIDMSKNVVYKSQTPQSPFMQNIYKVYNQKTTLTTQLNEVKTVYKSPHAGSSGSIREPRSSSLAKISSGLKFKDGKK